MRTLDSVLATAAKQPVVRIIALVRINFDSGVVAWHSGYGDLTFAGATYQGVGALGSISAVKEQPGIKSSSLSLQINGIKPEIVALALAEPYLNRSALVHIQMLDDQDRPLIATPLMIYKGTLDSIDGTMGSTGEIQIQIKSRLADWERPRKLRYTDADQQKLYPGDMGMEYIPQLSQRQLVWPKAAFLPDPRD